MLLKVGVITDGVQPPTWYALGVFEALYFKHGYELSVTSLVDGVHMVGSLHPKGLAADLRINGVPMTTMSIIRTEAHAILFKQGFDIVPEDDHLHVEYDPKPGRSDWLSKVA